MNTHDDICLSLNRFQLKSEPVIIRLIIIKVGSIIWGDIVYCLIIMGCWQYNRHDHETRSDDYC